MTLDISAALQALLNRINPPLLRSKGRERFTASTRRLVRLVTLDRLGGLTTCAAACSACGDWLGFNLSFACASAWSTASSHRTVAVTPGSGDVRSSSLHARGRGSAASCGGGRLGQGSFSSAYNHVSHVVWSGVSW